MYASGDNNNDYSAFEPVGMCLIQLIPPDYCCCAAPTVPFCQCAFTDAGLTCDACSVEGSKHETTAEAKIADMLVWYVFYNHTAFKGGTTQKLTDTNIYIYILSYRGRGAQG